jgi:hypothetical protein
MVYNLSPNIIMVYLTMKDYMDKTRSTEGVL